MKSFVVAAFLLLLGAPMSGAAEAARNIFFIVDGSGSMWQRIDNETKIDIARRVLAERVENLAPDISAGLIAYGHRRENDCADIETLVELGSGDHAELLTRLREIQPRGMTPIAASIERAVEKLTASNGPSSIILVTDGKENCSADPCAAVERLKARAAFSVQVVGFDIIDEQDALQLKCLAAAGGGKYYTAANAAGLDQAFRAATKREKQGSEPVTSREHVQIVLDTSSAMLKPFDGTTRLAAATAAIANVLRFQVAGRDSLALRRFGGPCEGENTDLVLGFARNMAQSITRALPGLPTGGRTTLVDAANAAIDDFDPPEAFADASKRVVIITGGVDPCYAHVEAGSLIRQRLVNRSISPDFRFIGIDLPPDKQLELTRIAAATGGKLSIVRSQAELELALEQILEVEPAVERIDSIEASFNQMVDGFAEAVNMIENRRYDEAEFRIARLRDTAQAVAPTLLELSSRKSNEDLVRVFDSAHDLQSIQQQMTDIAERLLMQHRSGAADGYNDSARSYNALIADYAEIARGANESIDRLRQAVRADAGK